MKPSSSNWTKAVKMEHTGCGAKWDMYASDWPPAMAICPACGALFKLLHYNPKTDALSFRRLN